MSTYAGGKLSGSTDGRPVKVAATAIGSGTTIHTAQSSATLFDYITLYASNPDTADHVLTLGWGGTTDPDDLIVLTIPSKSGLVLVTYKLPLRNSLVVKAAADSANKIVLTGRVIVTS